MILSILILTIKERENVLESLMRKITLQIKALSAKDELDYFEMVQVLQDPREKVTKGEKRNALLQAAAGEYVCFVDDDDDLSDDYLETIVEAIRYQPDCLSLRGIMTTNGLNPEVFEHSLKYNEWRETSNPIKYERYPNHLNVIRADIAKQFKFPHENYGEDKAWSDKVYKSGMLKNEYYIDKVLYYYKYLPKK